MIFLNSRFSQEFFQRVKFSAHVIHTAAHWDAVGGGENMTDCDLNSVVSLHSVYVFIIFGCSQN